MDITARRKVLADRYTELQQAQAQVITEMRRIEGAVAILAEQEAEDAPVEPEAGVDWPSEDEPKKGKK